MGRMDLGDSIAQDFIILEEISVGMRPVNSRYSTGW
jgi:hypothetical protein